MFFPVYLPLLLSAFLLILALIAAGEHHLSGHGFSRFHTACPAICSLTFFLIILILTILCCNTTTIPPLSPTWLVLNWLHVCLGLMCMVSSNHFVPRETTHSCQYTPVWYFQQLARPCLPRMHLFLFYCVVPIVIASEIGGLALVLDQRRFEGCLFLVLGITVTHAYITTFYLWSIWKRREIWREDWRKQVTHEARSIICLLVVVLATAVSWAIIPLIEDIDLDLGVSVLVVISQPLPANGGTSGKLSFLMFVLPYGSFRRDAFRRRLTGKETDRDPLAHSDSQLQQPLWKASLTLHEHVAFRFFSCVFNSLWEVYLVASILF